MKIARSITALVAVVIAVLALVGAPSAAVHAQPSKVGKELVALDQSGNAAVGVQTELDCSSHTFTAKVTNKLGDNISPDVTFNDAQPELPSSMPIEPGKTGNYYFSYSGNHLLMKTKVMVDGYNAVTVTPTFNCEEPLSFQVTQTSSSAVIGRLTNNSDLVAQTALLRVDNGDIRTENLAAGESRIVALPFTPNQGQVSAYVNIGNTTGYEGSYSVDLNQTPPVTPLP